MFSSDCLLLKVYKALRQGVQPVAVKKITQADEWQMTQFIKVLSYLLLLSQLLPSFFPISGPVETLPAMICIDAKGCC